MGYELTISATKYKASNNDETYSISDETADGHTIIDDNDIYSISNETADGYTAKDVITNWILRDGTWRDEGIWIDNEIWKDS